jgi:hypothetical protein
MINTRRELEAAVRAAEMIAGRLEMAGHKLSIGERRAIAKTLQDLTDVARRVLARANTSQQEAA